MKIALTLGSIMLFSACSHFPQFAGNSKRSLASQATTDRALIQNGTYFILGNMDFPFHLDVKAGEVLSQPLFASARNNINCEAQHFFRGGDTPTKLRVRSHKDIYVLKSKELAKDNVHRYSLTYIFEEDTHVQGEPLKQVVVNCLTSALPEYEFKGLVAGELDDLFKNFNVRVRTQLQDVDHRDTLYEEGYGVPINK